MDSSPTNINTNGSQSGIHEVAEPQPPAELLSSIIPRSSDEGAATEHHIQQLNGGNSSFQSEDTDTSMCNVDDEIGIILDNNVDTGTERPGETFSSYSVDNIIANVPQVFGKDSTATAPATVPTLQQNGESTTASVNQILQFDVIATEGNNLTVKNDHGEIYSWLQLENKKVFSFDGKIYYQVPADATTQDTNNVEAQPKPEDLEFYSSKESDVLDSVSSKINDGRIESFNSSNETPQSESINDPQSESTSDTTQKPVSIRIQKRKKVPLYKQPEPEDPEERVRWKRACTTERNRQVVREKIERTNSLEKRTNSLEKELAEYKDKYNKSEEMRKTAEARVKEIKAILSIAMEK